MTTPENSNASEAQATPELHQALTQTIRFLARLGRERFFARIVITFEGGAITTPRKEETIKRADMPR